MADHFITKTRVFREDCLVVDQTPAIDSHAELTQFLSNRVGPDVVALFAEPFISRSAEDGKITVAWYTDVPGRCERLVDLPQDRAARVEARIVALTRALTHLAEEDGPGELVRAALSIGSRGDIWAVDDRPVIVNWGMASGAGQADSTLAGLILSARGRTATDAGPAAVTGTAAAAAASPAPASPVPNAPPDPAPAATTLAAQGLPRIAWVPLVVLLGLATVVLLWLLVPSTRVFFAQGLADPAALATPDRAAAEEAALAALLERKQALETALAGAQCRADGLLELPGGLRLDGTALPPPGVSPEAKAPLQYAPLLPVSPRRLSLTGMGAETLLDQLEATTVLVLAGDGMALSTGTGFSLGDGWILSNAHVVQPAAEAGQTFVAHKSLAQPVAARIIKISAPFEQSGTDLALLQVDDTTLPALHLRSGGSARKLSPVVAAGFPADLMETDTAYAALLAGEAATVPDLAVVDGIITSEQVQPHGSLLFHTAPLSHGNSGGPLVDYCGAVVGVNSFVRQGALRTLNIALSAGDVLAFLADTPASGVPQQDQPCQPAVATGTGPSAGEIE